MSPEGLKPSDIIRPIAIIGGLFFLSQFAFSKETARKIGKRAGWKSEISGLSFFDGWVLHMAHLNHDKSNPLYDHESNGICVTVPEHLEMHEAAKGQAIAMLGMACEEANDYAIKKLKATPVRTWKWLALRKDDNNAGGTKNTR